MKTHFAGSLDGKKVYGVLTDPNRPTCGNLLNKSLCNKLVVDSDLKDFTLFDSGLEAYKWTQK